MQICVDSRAPLVPIGSLITCTSQRLALEHDASRSASAARCARPVAVVRPRCPDVGDVQERGALEADVDERRLHAGQHARDLAEVDVADQAALERALDVQLLHGAVLDDRDARFLRGPVDQDVLHGVESVHGGAREWPRQHATPRRLEQLRRLVQRQAHDAGVAARRCARSRPRRGPGSRRRRPCRTARRWRHSARSRAGVDRREAHARHAASPARRASAPSHAPPRSARGACGPTARASMRAASAASAGLPRMRAPSATVVSAQRIGAGGERARAQRARVAASQLGARHALDVVRRAPRPRRVASSASASSSASAQRAARGGRRSGRAARAGAGSARRDRRSRDVSTVAAIIRGDTDGSA